MGAFFAAMRAEIEAEGGTVEKFIGDAVMAAFGVPRVARGRPRARPARRAAHAQAPRRPERGARRALRRRARAADRHQHRLGDGRHRPAPGRGARDRRCGQRRRAHRAGGRAGPGARRRAHGAGRAALPLRRRRTCSRCAAAASRCAPSSCSPISRSPRARSRARAPRSSAGDRELELLTVDVPAASVAEGRPHLVTLYGEAGVGKSRLVAELLAGLEAAVAGAARPARPLPRLRRRHQLLAARRDAEGARAGARHRPGRRRPRRASPPRPRRRSPPRAPTRRRRSPRRSRRASASRPADRVAAQRAGGARRDAPRLALVLLGARGERADDRARRGPALGRRRGARAARGRRGPCLRPGLRALHRAARADDAAADLGRRADAASPGSPSSRSTRPRARSSRSCCSTGTPMRASAPRSSRAPRAIRSSSRRSRARARGAPRAPAACPTRCTRRSPRASTCCRPTRSARCRRRRWSVACSGPARVAEVAALDAGSVGELLDRLQNRDLVLGRLSSSMSGQRELIFKHALICEVAYESLPRRDRARMHGTVADWIEQTFAGSPRRGRSS